MNIRLDPRLRCVVHALPMNGSDALWRCPYCGHSPKDDVRALDPREWPPRAWPPEAHAVIDARREKER